MYICVAAARQPNDAQYKGDCVIANLRIPGKHPLNGDSPGLNNNIRDLPAPSSLALTPAEGGFRCPSGAARPRSLTCSGSPIRTTAATRPRVSRQPFLFDPLQRKRTEILVASRIVGDRHNSELTWPIRAGQVRGGVLRTPRVQFLSLTQHQPVARYSTVRAGFKFGFRTIGLITSSHSAPLSRS
jgi:hypothetical protein